MEIWSIAEQCCSSVSISDIDNNYNNSTIRNEHESANGEESLDREMEMRRDSTDFTKQMRFGNGKYGVEATGKKDGTRGARKKTKMPPLIGGRQLRRLALLAFAQHENPAGCTLDDFLETLKAVIKNEKRKRIMEE